MPFVSSSLTSSFSPLTNRHFRNANETLRRSSYPFSLSLSLSLFVQTLVWFESDFGNNIVVTLTLNKTLDGDRPKGRRCFLQVYGDRLKFWTGIKIELTSCLALNLVSGGNYSAIYFLSDMRIRHLIEDTDIRIKAFLHQTDAPCLSPSFSFFSFSNKRSY